MTSPAEARVAVERNALAIMRGDLMQVMADLTPEALGQLMQMGSQAGGISPAQMPNIEGYDVDEQGLDGDGQLLHVTFRSSVGTATLATTWKQVMGQWKLTAVSQVSAEMAG